MQRIKRLIKAEDFNFWVDVDLENQYMCRDRTEGDRIVHQVPVNETVTKGRETRYRPSSRIM